MRRLHIFLSPLVLLLAAPASAATELRTEETDDHILIRDGELVALTYHKADLPPPKGANPNYRRSGFIHPLHAPHGGAVTSVHAPDHTHHMGLWHAWVKTRWNNQEIDFWNLKKGAGRVRYKATSSLLEGGQSAGFTVLQEHVAYLGEEKKETVILVELLTVEMHKEGDAYIINYLTVQENPTTHDLQLPAYRYGGPLAYRGPLHWNTKNSRVLTSAGKTEKDGHESRANWVSYAGPTKKGDATVLLMTSPHNHDAPQRVRIWPPETNHGAPFFNFVPTQEKPWAIAAGDAAEHHYRIVVANGILENEAMAAFWKNFSQE